MPTESDNEIISFLSDFTGVAPHKINMHTNIEKGLGVAGGDGVDLLFEFSMKFNVDISEVNPSLYFGDEGMKLGLTDALRLLYRLISKKVMKLNLEILLVEDLVEAGKMGKLSHKEEGTQEKLTKSGPNGTSFNGLAFGLVDQMLFIILILFVLPLVVVLLVI